MQWIQPLSNHLNRDLVVWSYVWAHVYQYVYQFGSGLPYYVPYLVLTAKTNYIRKFLEKQSQGSAWMAVWNPELWGFYGMRFQSMSCPTCFTRTTMQGKGQTAISRLPIEMRLIKWGEHKTTVRHLFRMPGSPTFTPMYPTFLCIVRFVSL